MAKLWGIGPAILTIALRAPLHCMGVRGGSYWRCSIHSSFNASSFLAGYHIFWTGGFLALLGKLPHLLDVLVFSC